MLWSISAVSPLRLQCCWLVCLHLRQTFCQIPIHLNCTTLSAPVDDLFFRISPPPLCFMVRTLGWQRYWSDCFFISEENHNYTISFQADLILRKETENLDFFCLQKKNVFSIYHMHAAETTYLEPELRSKTQDLWPAKPCELTKNNTSN